MDLIEKTFRITESVLSCDNLVNEEAKRQDVGGSCSDKTKVIPNYSWKNMCHMPDSALFTNISQHYNRHLLSRSQKLEGKLCLLCRGLEQ